eukprot:TRINITY_DN61880_c0_g1_i1.p1 TRINITY_DN61880_c0_g1~~TRINITY_DN61880_c0_g1_i1.p1  ORF type:complete len:787 (+),score=108.85 TRINITY_DN61880_c0_g1_i1:337-2361(+)
MLRFEIVEDEDSLASAQAWAFVEISATDLARKDTWSLLVSHTDTLEAVYGTSRPEDGPDLVRRPCFLNVRVSCLDGSTAAPSPGVLPGAPVQKKKAMLVTRGTRGDVQPFVALARGLSEHCGCEVVVVTELRWKNFVKSNGKGLPTRLRFRPSGGDTTVKVNQRAAKMAMNLGQYSDTLQALMLSRSEVEFFPSEGCFWHWANQEKPDFIVFGFTLTHVAMIISESLRVPIVGFTLQPSRGIEQRAVDVGTLHNLLAPIREVIVGEEFQALLQQAMERIPSGDTLNSLRTSRGLSACPVDIDTEDRQTEALKRLRVPRVVPINPAMLLEQQVEQMSQDGMTLTDFIFLPEEPSVTAKALLSKVEEFIKQARRNSLVVVAMTFSSMPVGKSRMLEVAATICSFGKRDVACIVLAGGQAEDRPATQEEKAKRDVLEGEGKLMVVEGPVPFNRLFPQLDAIILHGGLGVTSEAIRAGLPTITSGILLMDQRYWAARLHEKNCGSEGIPISRLASKVLGLLEHTLPEDKAKGLPAGDWRQNAELLRKQLQQPEDPHGMIRNAKAVFEAGTLDGGAVIDDPFPGRQGCVRAMGRQGYCLLFCLERTLQWCLCMQIPSCLRLWLRCAGWCVCCPARMLSFLLPRRLINRLGGRQAPHDRAEPTLSSTLMRSRPDMHGDVV